MYLQMNKCENPGKSLVEDNFSSNSKSCYATNNLANLTETGYLSERLKHIFYIIVIDCAI